MKDHEETRKLMPLQGKDLGRYLLEDLIGEGASAVVFRARDKELNRLVAVKILKEVAALNPMMRKRFVREAQVVARISHPNVVTVHDVGTKDGISFLVMEFVEGKSLSYALETGMLKFRDRVEIVEKVARGIHAAHGEGVVHRDLKPANIILELDGEPKVADFGLAHVREPETRLTMSGATLGTPAYMAPEQVRGDIKSIGPKTDVYSLGVILYEMITKRIAFPGTTPVEMYRTIIEEEPVPPRKINPDISHDLETICLKAMDRESARRYGSALEFAEDLKRYRKGEPVMARPPSTIYKIRRALWRRKLITLPILAASVVLFCALAILIPRLEKASEEKKRAEQKVTSIKTENEKKDRESAQREAAFKKPRPYLDEARRIRTQIDYHLVNSKTKPDTESMQPLIREAFDNLKTALDLFPEYAEAYLEAGRLARIVGKKPTLYEAYFSQAIEADPTLATAYIERIQVRLEQNYELRFDWKSTPLPSTDSSEKLLARIRNDFQEIQEWSKDRKELKLAEGLIFVAEGEYERAAPLLREYAEAMISDHRAWQWLCTAEIGRKDVEAALKAVNNGLRYHPWDVNLYVTRLSAYNLLVAEQSRKGFSEKVKETRKLMLADARLASELNPDNITTLINLGQVCRAAGDREGAIKAYTKALEIDPERKGIHKNRGGMYLESGKMEAAIRDFGEEIRLSPEDGGAYYNRALAYLMMKKYDEAEADLDVAVERTPHLAKAWNTRASLRYRKQDYEGAASDARQALKVAPENWKYRAQVEKNLRALEKRLKEK